MLEIVNVSKKYKNGVFANQDISISIDDGQIYGFIGPNGAGKSTLIKTIVGLHKADSGEVKLNNLTLEKNEMEYKSQVAYIPDNPELYEALTGIGYLNFVCDIYGVLQEDRMSRIEKYADALEIKADLANQIKGYSHGMKQKLALVSAFIHKPKLLVLDEPFVGLDPKASFRLKELMKEFANMGNIIFFSSHVLEVVEKLCDRIGIINDGKVIFDGSIDNIKENQTLEEFFLEKTDE